MSVAEHLLAVSRHTVAPLFLSFFMFLLVSATITLNLSPSLCFHTTTTSSSSSSSSLYFHSFLPSRCAEPQTVLQLRVAPV